MEKENLPYELEMAIDALITALENKVLKVDQSIKQTKLVVYNFRKRVVNGVRLVKDKKK